jgi:hypothetical protein
LVNCYRNLPDIGTFFQRGNNKQNSVSDWFSKFKSGGVSVKEAEYSESLPISMTYGNVAPIKELSFTGANCESPISCRSSTTFIGRRADEVT